MIRFYNEYMEEITISPTLLNQKQNLIDFLLNTEGNEIPRSISSSHVEEDWDDFDDDDDDDD